jgi:UDP-N-acetylglucosamine diphosphorylase / glucose-1-phosphate thymidylyltransferase / UDP-N-acetylgalactosamine diphosphorylase / glucosamine-1-phosphate N-acetyltransferase / galactosamine-1-phosphate N-acetyltransferase
MFKPSNYLDEKGTDHWRLFADIANVWEALPKIAPYLKTHLNPGVHAHLVGQSYIGEHVFIGAGTHIDPGAVILGPAWIGTGCHIRPGAYVRENVLIGNECVIGNSCEFKNSILFNKAQVPHFSYVGDSILGVGAHLGAGVICSNLKLQGDEVEVIDEGQKYKTGLRKFGAILGDYAEVGCNAVLNPGSILGRRSLIYPGVQWRGVLPERSVAKATTTLRIVKRREKEK